MAATKATETESKTVTVVVPKDPGGDEMVFVALNAHPYNIPRGVPVELPEEVANIVFRSYAAEKASDAYSAERQRLMKKVQGAD